MSRAAERNLDYYGAHSDGRDDYWRLMAAPRHRVAVLLREIAARSPASVVDLGCGNGALLDEVRGRVPDATLAGIDLAADQIDRNRSRDPATRWITMDLDGERDVPPDALHAFDAVVATEVIEHLDDPAGFLRTARRLARNGTGRLYLSTQSGRVRETELRVGHRRHFTAAEMPRLFQENDWVPDRIWNTGFPFHDLSKWYANRDPGASMKRFSGRAYGARERLICWGLRQAFRLNSSSRGAQLFAVARAE